MAGTRGDVTKHGPKQKCLSNVLRDANVTSTIDLKNRNTNNENAFACATAIATAATTSKTEMKQVMR